ncbi:hypothetical protein K474DRAFT_1311776 [Panus rudis PR-1116 ss-1]|nr:hypothetical protein K474DRAFT_1311776 [Panus rudis PR-1116 ss-1]
MPELRRYENSQKKFVLASLSLQSASRDKGEATCQVRPSQRPCDMIALYRLRRFFDTYRGFFTGDLDLTGRHLPRWESISRRFDAFSKDYLSMIMHAKVVQREETNVLGEVEMITEYEFDPIEPFDNFLFKWQCWGTYSAMELAQETVKCVTMANGAQPKIQQLCLHHLPPELLIMIMERLCSHDALRFGSTCRLLRELSLPYIYSSRTIQLPLNLSASPVSSNDPEVKFKVKTTRYLEAQITLINQLHFLRDHPEITEQIRRAFIVDKWTLFDADHDIGASAWDEENEKVQVQKGLIAMLTPNVIAQMSNVENLGISCWPITWPTLESLARLTRLHTLELKNCSALSSLAPTTTVSLTVERLFFLHHDNIEATTILWIVLSICPHLQHLSFSVHRTDGTGFASSMPPLDFIIRVNPFLTLKTMIMDGLLLDDVETLTIWLALTTVPIPLRALKLVVDGGLRRETILNLLNALSHATKLRYLIIDGIRWAHPTLLDHVAQRFPELESLVLHYRESNIQFKTKPAQWPYSSWEYASHLANFHRLEYFGWNFRDSEAYYGTQHLADFENGYPDEEEVYRIRMKMSDEDKEVTECYEEGETIANILGAYCPTLRWVAFYLSAGFYSTSCCVRIEGSEHTSPRFEQTWNKTGELRSRMFDPSPMQHDKGWGTHLSEFVELIDD